MKKIKSILSLLLVLAMAISIAVPVVSATEFTDVPDTHQYYSAIQSLVNRGIIAGKGDGIFDPDANIKRSEFAKMVMAALGQTGVANTVVESTGFPDVAPNHWAAGFIKAAYDRKIINGYDDGTFKPDENVTYEQAIKMVVCAKSPILAKTAESELYGGYPQGYIKVAESYQMVKGITDGDYKAPAKRGTIAKLVDNMLKAELSSEELGGLPVVDENKLEEEKGQIVAIKGLSLIDGDTTALSANQIKVIMDNGDVAIYNISNLKNKNEIRSWLGKHVVLYYEEEISIDVQYLSSISEQRGRNYEFTLDVDDIASYTNTNVEYYDANDDERKLTVSSSATIIYNGSYYDTKTFKGLLDDNISKAGSIRFLSTDGEGTAADIIFFTSYTNWYVTSVNSSSKLVYGEYYDGGVLKTGSIVVDDEAKNKNVTITKNGSAAEFKNIAKGQILSISESEDHRFMEVLISDKVPSGKVTSLTASEKKLTIGSTQYEFASDVTFGSDIIGGVNLKLYLDAFGKVAKYTFQTSSVSYTYGYLLQTIRSGGTAFANKMEMQILNVSSTANKTPIELYLADVVTINGRNYTLANDYESIMTLLKATAEYYDAASAPYDFGADLVCQPIKYSTSEGKIKNILIGKQAEPATDADLKIEVKNGIVCTTNNITLGGIYNLTSSTKVVYVPDNDSDREDYTAYTIRNGSNSGFVKDTSYDVVMVDINNSGAPALVLVYGASAGPATEWVDNLPMVVVSKEQPDKDKYMLTLYGSNGEYVCYDETGVFHDAVSEGDIIRVSVDSDKFIEDIEVVATAVDIYSGAEFIKDDRADSRSVTRTGATLSGTNSLVKEGEWQSEDAAEMVLMAGVAYSMSDTNMIMALDYPAHSLLDWSTNTALANAGLLKNFGISGAKVVAVNFDGSGNVKDRGGVEVSGVEASQITTYTTDGVVSAGADANKIFVYRTINSAKLIVVYRAAQ